MKNFLWFFHKPADEREQLLFSRAYQRALMAIWIVFVVFLALFYPGAFNTKESVPSYVLGTVMVFSLGISYLAGWTVIHKDELLFEKDPEEVPVPYIRTLIMYLSIEMIVMVACVYIWVELYDIIGVLFIGISRITLGMFAWRILPHISIPIRLAGILIIPEFIIMFRILKRRAIILKLLGSVGLFLVYMLILVVSILFIRNTIVEPIFIETNVFEPDIAYNTFMLVNKTAHAYHEGEYIAVQRSNSREIFVAKILSMDGSSLRIHTSNGELDITTSEVVGRLVTMPFPYNEISKEL